MIARRTAIAFASLAALAAGLLTPGLALGASARETAFLRTVDRRMTADVVTANLTYYAGTHVAYVCEIQNVVQPGVALGDCGSSVEPVSLFIHLPTQRLKTGDRVRILGVIEQPVPWTNVTGHTVYYAFLKALFVDSLPAERS